MSLSLRNFPRPAVIALVAAAALAASACGGGEDAQGGAPGKLAVVATTMQLQDFAREVGGARAEVAGILGPGDEPHEYEPSPRDAEAVADAGVVIENGAGLDAWLDDLLANAGGDAIRVSAARGVKLLPTEEEGFRGDPHIWHDPQRAKLMVDNVAAGLVKADPGGRALYERNATTYKASLDAMAARIRRIFAPIPPADRKLITTHDAFGYFVRAYGIEQVGTVLPALTTESEPSGRQVRELVEKIRAEGVKTLFTEEAINPTLERQIADEAGATISSTLYADVLGRPGTKGDTFIGAELANARAMAAAWRP